MVSSVQAAVSMAERLWVSGGQRSLGVQDLPYWGHSPMQALGPYTPTPEPLCSTDGAPQAMHPCQHPELLLLLWCLLLVILKTVKQCIGNLKI